MFISVDKLTDRVVRTWTWCAPSKFSVFKSNLWMPTSSVKDLLLLFEIYSDYACLKVSRETLRTIYSFPEQSRSIQSIKSMKTISTTDSLCSFEYLSKGRLVSPHVTLLRPRPLPLPPPSTPTPTPPACRL